MSPPIIRLRKQLSVPPILSTPVGIRIRKFRFTQDDIDEWLRIHNMTLADLGGGRDWNSADFSREFASLMMEFRLNVTPTCQIWLAEETPHASKERATAGTVSLRVKETQLPDQPRTATINWLAVDPKYRRRGVATSLLHTTDLACWQLGVRHIELTTHRDWQPAVALYTNLGFR